MKKDMVFLFIVLGGFFVSCTSGFREFNTDLAGITDEDLKVTIMASVWELSSRAFILIMITVKGKTGLSN